jgi:hypothetical protein
MAFKNKNATPAKAAGTPSTGNAAPYAKLPANNNGTFPVKLGVGQNSNFGKNTGPASAQKSAQQPKGSAKANLQTHNGPRTNVSLGTTKHGVGEVPGYLQHKYGK